MPCPRPALPLIALLLAGCAAPAAGPEPPRGEPVLALGWDLVDCAYVAFTVPVPPENLAPHLPPGFTPATGSRVPVDTPIPGVAYLGMEAFRCARGQGLGETVEDLAYGSFFTPVKPPSILAREGVDSYYVKWDTLVPDAPRREALAQRGLLARAGDAHVETETVGSQVRVRAGLAFEDGGGFTLTGVGQAAGGGDAFPFIEYAPGANATLAAWRALAQERDASVRGRGVVEVEAGSFAAQVMGTTRAAVTFTAGTWTFAEGALTHPVGRAEDVR